MSSVNQKPLHAYARKRAVSSPLPKNLTFWYRTIPFCECSRTVTAYARDSWQGRSHVTVLTHRRAWLVSSNIYSRIYTFSSPEAALLLVSTKNRDLWPGPTAFRFWQTWLWTCAEWREVRESRTSGVGLGQRSRYLVLTKRSAASGEENVYIRLYIFEDTNQARRCVKTVTWLFALGFHGLWSTATRTPVDSRNNLKRRAE